VPSTPTPKTFEHPKITTDSAQLMSANSGALYPLLFKK
jgi:hypothetical protein